MAAGLSLEEANRLKNVLVQAGIFADAVVEPDTDAE
jgi:hypothetical protein